jgi:cohesin loading factor subunit SCC2
MASPGIDRQVVNEEAIEACIVLMRFHISRHILPSVNQLPFPGLSDKPTTTTTTTPTTSAKKRRRSSSSNSNTSTIFKKVYPYVLETVGATVLLLERFDGLLQQVPLDDQELILIASGALQTLECDPSNAAISLCQQLHIATVTLLTRIFRNNPRLRPIILEDLFPLLIKVPTSKKTMHLWPLHQNHQHDTILHPSGLFASSNRQQRAPQTIQTVSALIMNLVQSCVVRPSTTTSTNIDTSTDTPPAPPYSSGLLHCQAACDLFLRNLLQRCRKKGPDGGASEYRPVLNHLLEDWLSVLKVACIAYPSAEILLLTVANYMSRELVVLSSEKKQSSVETTYLNTIFDALGKLCANQAHMLKVAREQPFPKAPLQPYPLEDKHVHCYCSEHKHTWLDKALMLNCDCCNTWYHGNCVGMNSRESVPEEWFCDACQMNRIMSYLQDQQKSNTSTNQIYDSPRPSQESLETGMTTTYAMQRLLMDYVRILVQKQESTQHHHQYEGEWKDAYEFHLARWMDQTTTNSTTMIPKWLEIWDAPTLENNNNKNNVNTDDLSSLSGMLQCLSEQGRIRIIMLLACHGLLKTFQRQVDWMVKFMAHDHSALYRKLSLKAIEKVTEADPTLMMYPFLRTAVTARFRDEAISVREAAVSLVGSYVVQSQSPTVANAFHTAFMVGLQDTGVSVRKRTIHILQNILLYNPNYKGRAQSCSELLKLAADPKEDDGVRDLIHDLFLKVWLDQGDQTVAASPSPLSKGNPKTPSMAHCCMEGLEGATLHTPPPPSQHKEILTPLTRETQSLERRSKTRRLQIRSEIAAEQMVQVIKASGDEGKNLTFLLKEIIGQAQDKYKTKFKSRRRKSSSSTSYMAQDHCTLLVDALLELLLSFEENRLLLSEPGKELAAIMRTIQVFTEVSPISVVPHLDTLLPYLKADNGLDSIQEEAVLVSSLSEIISRVSASLDEQDLDRIAQGGLGDDLVQVTYKLGRGALSSASQALCRLAHHPCRSLVFGQKVLYLANTFYKVLNKYKEIDNFSNQPAKIKANVHRALSVLGSICRYHETALLLEEDSLSTNIVLTWENLTGHCKHLFSLYLESKLDASTKCAALRALCGVFIAHPRILLEMNQMGIIGKVMASTAPLSLQLESLICWREILLVCANRDLFVVLKSWNSHPTFQISR